MSDRRQLLDAFVRETEPNDIELAVLKRAIDPGADRRVSRALLQRLPGPSEIEIARLRASVGRPSRRRSGISGLAVAGGLVAAALLFAVGVGVGRSFAPASEPDRPVEVAIGGPGPSGVVAVGRSVRLEARGTGKIAGTERAPRIEWTAGEVGVEVEPGRGIALAVVTREAEVRVVGTAFEVRRDALGTAVEVAHGRVEVRCVAGGLSVLGAGEETICLPTTAPGLLGRANQLKTSGADPALVLAAADLGLPTAKEPFLGELVALRAEALLALGRAGEAEEEAVRYLALGGPRELDLLKLAASAALAERGCAGALPYLQRLEERGAADPEQLERCEEER